MNKIVKIISYVVAGIFLLVAAGSCFYVSQKKSDEALQSKCQAIIGEIDKQILENETLQKEVDALHLEITELENSMN